MEGCFTFQWGAGRVFVFQMSVRPVMGIGFNEGVSEKKFRMGVATMGNPIQVAGFS